MPPSWGALLAAAFSVEGVLNKLDLLHLHDNQIGAQGMACLVTFLWRQGARSRTEKHPQFRPEAGTGVSKAGTAKGSRGLSGMGQDGPPG